MSRFHTRRRFRVVLRRRRDERGAYAVLFSMMLVLVMALAAIAVDIASNVSSKQHLKDTMDAAAHAGAFALAEGGVPKARSEIERVARANDSTANPMIDTWCVVGSTGGDKQVNKLHIPATCDPGKGEPYTASHYPGLICDDTVCFIPCDPDLPSAKCNTVRVTDEKTVPYAFAPAIGYDEGSTGAVVSVACNGPCGEDPINPLDVVLMADRTASMLWSDRDKMKKAMLAMLPSMNPRMHAVALGTLHKSRTIGFTQKSKAGSPQTSTDLNKYNGHWDGTGDTDGDGFCKTEAVKLENVQKLKGYEDVLVGYEDVWEPGKKGKKGKWVKKPIYEKQPVYETELEDPEEAMSRGDWVPVKYRTDYVIPETKQIVNSSPLVDGISCLSQSKSGEFGTHLAAALKGAARYVINNSPPGVEMANRPGEVKKVIIFETDGLPDEVVSSPSSALTLNNVTEIGAGGNSSNSGNGKKGCDNFLEIARQAKEQGVLLITIGFGQAATGGCTKVNNTTSKGTPVRDVLAAAASPRGSTPATAGDCTTGAGQAEENSDGDYFFCSTNGDDLAEIFLTAFNSVTGGIRYLKMPG